MYKLHNIKKHNTGTVSFWRNKKKTYTAYLSIEHYADKKTLNEAKQRLFEDGELTVFYKIIKGNNIIGIIEDRNGQNTILNHRRFIERKKGFGIEELGEYLLKYGMLTLYYKDGLYSLETFYN